MDNVLIVYLIPIVGAGIALFVWQKYFASRRPREQAKTKVEGEKTIKARIYDCDHRTIYNQDISEETAKKIKEKSGSLGRQFTRFGEKVYPLQLKGGEYSPAPVGASGAGISPRSIGVDLAIGYSIALYYRPQMPQGAGGNIKQILWWTGIIAVIIFMAVVD